MNVNTEEETPGPGHYETPTPVFPLTDDVTATPVETGERPDETTLPTADPAPDGTADAPGQTTSPVFPGNGDEPGGIPDGGMNGVFPDGGSPFMR